MVPRRRGEALEWAANPQGAVFTLLLRRSDAGGGGDYFGRGPQVVELPDGDDSTRAKALADVVLEGVFHEGRKVSIPPDLIVGRWAGDRILLVGDYDSSGLYDEAQGFRNISEPLAREWNAFIELPDMKVEVGCVPLARTVHKSDSMAGAAVTVSARLRGVIGCVPGTGHLSPVRS